MAQQIDLQSPQKGDKSIMEGFPTGITLYVDMTAREWAYVNYLFVSVGAPGIDSRDASAMYLPPATKYQSELTVRVDIQYLLKYMRLAYLSHIDMNAQGKDSEEWHGNDLKDRNKIMEDMNTILNKINPQDTR